MRYTVLSLDGERVHEVNADHWHIDQSGALWFYGPHDDSRPTYPPPVVRVFSGRYWSQFLPDDG